MGRQVDTRRVVLVVLVAATLLASSGCAVIQRVLQSPSGQVPEGHAQLSAIDGTGRYVVFSSNMDGLVAGPDTHRSEVYRRDVQTGVTDKVSVGMGGAAANEQSGAWQTSISDGGRFVVFASRASNLVPGDDNGADDIFVRDLVDGTTELISVALDGTPGDQASGATSISADGRFVAFESSATDLTSDPSQAGSGRIYLRDRQLDTTTRVASVPPYLVGLRISADASTIVFSSDNNGLVPGDNGGWDVFSVDVATHAIERIDVDSNEVEADHTAFLQILNYGVSADGRFVAFESAAPNLVPGDTNGDIDVFVRDRVTGTTERVDVTSSGAQGTNTGRGAIGSVDIDRSGRTVAFVSGAALAPGDTSSFDAYVHDRTTGQTTLVSTTDELTAANGDALRVALSADGRLLAWDTPATNIAGTEPTFYFGTDHIFVRGTVVAQANSLNPATLAAGASSRVTIFGHGLRPGTQVRASGSGVTITAITIVDDGRLKVSAHVAPGAAVGPRDVYVTSEAPGPNGQGTVITTCTGCLTITP